MPAESAPSSNRPAARGLADEIGKRHPFESAAHEAYLNLLKTHDLLAGRHEDLFRRHGISSPLYNVLRILRGREQLGVEQGLRPADCPGVPVYTVARDMVARGPDITRLADRLEKLGHVERRRCPHDRRVVRLKLTASGRKLADHLKGPTMALVDEHFAPLSERDIKTLSRLLHKVRQQAEDD